MAVKYTKHFLNKLEDLFAESDYHLRYERGNFNSGYCVLKDKKIIMVNKYYTLEGKINCLVEIVKEVALDTSQLKEKSRELYDELTSRQLKL